MLENFAQTRKQRETCQNFDLHVGVGYFQAKDVIAAIEKGNGEFTIKMVCCDTLIAYLKDGQVILTCLMETQL